MATKALREQRLSLIAVMAALMGFIVEAQVPTAPPAPPTTTTPAVPPAPPTTTPAAVPPPARTPTPVGCTNANTALSPCANYVTGSNVTASSACCNAFVFVIINGPTACLCQFLSTQNPLGLSVNQTQVLALPAACNVMTPSFATQCSAIGVPLTPTSGLPITPSSPGSSPAPKASAPTALPSPGPSTTGGTPGTVAVPPTAGIPASSGIPVSTPSGGSSSNNSRPSSNSGVSVSAVFAQSTGSLIVGVILASILM